MEASMQSDQACSEEEVPSNIGLDLQLQRRKLTTLTPADLKTWVEASCSRPLASAVMVLQILDLSCNNLRLLPTDAVNKENTPNLRSLNLSRNLLKTKAFFTATTSANHVATPDFLRLSELPLLTQLDLRFNERLGEPEVVAAIRAQLGERSDGQSVTVLASLWGQMVGASPSERDATLLRSQLEPLPTRVLRERLSSDFCRHFLDDGAGFLLRLPEIEREEAMQKLIACYHTEGLDGPLDAIALRTHADAFPIVDRGQTSCRHLVRFAGVPIDPSMLQLLDTEIRLWAARQDSTVRVRERPSIQAQNYMILRRPEGVGAERQEERQGKLQEDVQDIQARSVRLPRKAYLRSKKIAQNKTLWDLAHQIAASVDPVWADRFNELAVTQNFEGSPHIDKQNTGPFYALSIGDFGNDAGGICVEVDARTVAVMDTHNRLGLVDGRYPHWVAPWRHSGTERFSLILYSTDGEYEPPGPAVPANNV